MSSGDQIISDFMNEMGEEEETQQKYAEMLSKMSDEDVLALMKKVNPYSTTIKGDKERSVSFSFTNLRVEYIQQLTTTAMIGYLFQRCMIYEVPEEVKPVSIAEYLKLGDEALQPPDFIKDDNLLEKYQKNAETMKERVIIYKWLKTIFSYNPDEHVRSSWYPVKDDNSRALIGTTAGRVAVQTKNTVRNIDEDQDHYPQVEDLPDPVEAGQAGDAVYEQIPAADHFDVFNNYLEDNYDKFIEVVYNIYGSKPDIDMAINVYKTHDDIEDAKAFRSEYMDEVIAGIYNVPMNKWAILAPYAENKEKEDFFNRETVQLKGMLDNREEKSKLAKDMLKKRVNKKKKKNIEENGPDAKAFKDWAKSNTDHQSSFGKEYEKDNSWETTGIVSENKKIDEIVDASRAEERAKSRIRMFPKPVSKNASSSDVVTNIADPSIKNTVDPSEDSKVTFGNKTKFAETAGDSKRVIKDDDDECPSNAVEVGVFKISNGGLNFHEDKIYTKAEAPKHLGPQ